MSYEALLEAQNKLEELTKEYPQEFCCGILFHFPEKPILAPSGHLYDEVEILKAIKRTNKDPYSGELLEPKDLDYTKDPAKKALNDQVSKLFDDLTLKTSSLRKAIRSLNDIKVIHLLIDEHQLWLDETKERLKKLKQQMRDKHVDAFNDELTKVHLNAVLNKTRKAWQVKIKKSNPELWVLKKAKDCIAIIIDENQETQLIKQNSYEISLSNNQLRKIAVDFHREYTQINEQIEKELSGTPLQDINDKCINFSDQVDKLIKQTSQKLSHALSEVNMDALIIRDNLKLNWHNQDHLSYWQNQTWQGFRFYSAGKTVELEGVKYKVPTRIYAMMQVAANPESYDDVYQTFSQKLAIARNQSANHSLSWIARSPITTHVYSEKIDVHLKVENNYYTGMNNGSKR